MANVILTTDESGKERAFSNLKKACEEISTSMNKISYSTIQKKELPITFRGFYIRKRLIE